MSAERAGEIIDASIAYKRTVSPANLKSGKEQSREGEISGVGKLIKCRQKEIGLKPSDFPTTPKMSCSLYPAALSPFSGVVSAGDDTPNFRMSMCAI